MTLFISVISHDHDHIIEQLETLARLATYPQIKVIFRDNVKSQELQTYCESIGIQYHSNDKPLGFAANNNLNFLLALAMGLSGEDYFLLLNPDVEISDLTIKHLLSTLAQSNLPMMAPNLFLDRSFRLADDNLRRFPTFGTFLKNYLLRSRSSVVDRTLPTDGETFWASGAFLVVKAHVYQHLNGLDERYFMYCEDIDFCFRALQEGIKVSYLPDIIAIHYRRCASRRFGSRLFFHHVKSTITYELTRRNWQRSWHRKSNPITVSASTGTSSKGAVLDSANLVAEASTVDKQS
ncbi:glycosyltransferase family 2 protein [Vibrio sp. PNB23_22_6]